MTKLIKAKIKTFSDSQIVERNYLGKYKNLYAEGGKIFSIETSDSTLITFLKSKGLN